MLCTTYIKVKKQTKQYVLQDPSPYGDTIFFQSKRTVTTKFHTVLTSGGRQGTEPAGTQGASMVLVKF